MALSITSNYSGTESTSFYAKALLGNSTSANVTILPNIKFKQNLKLFDVGNLVQSGSTCSWTPSGDITLTEKVIEPKEHKLQTSICISDLEQHWESAKLRYW